MPTPTQDKCIPTHLGVDPKLLLSARGSTIAGKAAPQGAPASSGTKPQPGAGKAPEEDITDEIIEKTIGDPQKRLLEMAKRKVPRYSDEFKDDTPRSQFLDDLQTGTEKAKEYIEYISKAAEYVEKYGKGLEGVAEGATELKKITEKLSSGLGKVGGVIQKAKQISQWITAVDNFADASAQMNPKDRKSVERWVKSMQNLWDRTAPFVDWLKDKATAAAIVDGSEAAGALSATLSIVAAQLYVGGQVLEAGVKNVNAYLDRYDKIMKEIDREAGQGPPEPPRKPEPVAPTPWMSREERAEDAKRREDAELRGKMRYERDSKIEATQEARKKAVEKATDEFENKLFINIYQAHRPEIRRKILAAVRKAGSKTQSAGASPESKWWDCLMTDGAAMDTARDSGDDSLTGGPFFDKQAGIYADPKKARVSNEEALQEISEFQHVSPPCPFFKELHDSELKKQIAKATAEQ
jgi:hypothetical protein